MKITPEMFGLTKEEVAEFEKQDERLAKIHEKFNSCPSCHKPIGGPRNFRDAEARFEFYATGLCQACQDLKGYDRLIGTVLAYTQEPEREMP